MTITQERLQELIARASMVESIEISKENMDEYREILRMAEQYLNAKEVSLNISINRYWKARGW